jgi:RimJ/RimL family protein N-acetyltransferase
VILRWSAGTWKLRVVAYAIHWRELVAIEPSPAELAAHVGALVTAYNHPRNAPLLGHTSLLDEADVLEHYETLAASGAHPFLLLSGERRNHVLLGDGDLRDLRDGAAELAFLIAAPEAQGKGLGTRFAIMLHALAFGELGLHRVHASLVPANVASRRVFDKLGYVVDDGPEARARGDAGDVTLSIDRAAFEARHAPQLREIQIGLR